MWLFRIFISSNQFFTATSALSFQRLMPQKLLIYYVYCLHLGRTKNAYPSRGHGFNVDVSLGSMLLISLVFSTVFFFVFLA
jgi:hypothetical protein